MRGYCRCCSWRQSGTPSPQMVYGSSPVMPEGGSGRRRGAVDQEQRPACEAPRAEGRPNRRRSHGRLMQRTPWIVGSPRNPRHTAVARIECPRCGAHSILDAAALGVSTRPNILQVATRTGIVYGRVLKFRCRRARENRHFLPFARRFARQKLSGWVSAPSCWPGQLARSRRGFADLRRPGISAKLRTLPLNAAP